MKASDLQTQNANLIQRSLLKSRLSATNTIIDYASLQLVVNGTGVEAAVIASLAATATAALTAAIAALETTLTAAGVELDV